MVIFVYHSYPPDTTTGNYFLNVLKNTANPVTVYSHKKPILWNQYNDVDLLLKIDDGDLDTTPYKNYFKHNAFVAIDTHTDIYRIKAMAKNFNYVFVAQQEHLSEIENSIWLPAACDPIYHTSIYKSLAERPIEIGFAGSTGHFWNTERDIFLDKLKSHFGSRFVHSNGGRGELSQILGSSKILVNQLCNNDINMRFMESLCAGGIVISQFPKNNGFEDLHLDRYCIEANDYDDMISKIEDALNNLDKYEERVKSQMKFVRTYHTYQNRFNKIIEVVSSNDTANI